MNPMFRAMADELMKIAGADAPTAIGRLVNADVGKNQFPDSGQTRKAQERTHTSLQELPVSSTSPNPEESTSEGSPGYGGFTYD